MTSILGISIQLEKTTESNRLTNRAIKKRLPSLLCYCCMDFKLNFFLLKCSGCVQYKNAVDLVEVSIFSKLEKTSGQTVRPVKIKTASTFLSYHSHLVFK